MHRAFKTSIESGKTENYTPDEMISCLINAEWDDRKNRNMGSATLKVCIVFSD
jgi:hypothetical protein